VQPTKNLPAKLDELERKIATHDRATAGLIYAIRRLLNPRANRRGDRSGCSRLQKVTRSFEEDFLLYTSAARSVPIAFLSRQANF
jgi:hypothetical protein